MSTGPERSERSDVDGPKPSTASTIHVAVVALLLAVPTLGVSLLLAPAAWVAGRRSRTSPSRLAADPADVQALRLGLRRARVGTVLLAVISVLAGGATLVVVSGMLRQG